jgi:signal transduction histidine kinase/CheY-like chemotaxis protein/PAS domain-containing protein
MKPERTAEEAAALVDLRRQAAERLAARPVDNPPTDPAEIERLLHQLRLRQIELELQNEELRRANARPERSPDAELRTREPSTQANAALLQIAGRTARLGGWSVNLAAPDQVLWSDEVAAIHDRPPGYTPSVEEGIGYYAPEWRGRIVAVFGACAREGRPYDEEMEVITARGRRIWVRTAGQALRDESGAITCVQGAFQDITDHKRAELVMAARMRLLRLASDHSLAELLRDTLDEAEALTGSQVGFYHFVAADQATLSLQTWSTNTTRHMCTARGAGTHYPVDRAGVWVDCIHARRPVIHNDYASLPHRKGLPEGHAPVIREVVVPVLRGNLIVAVLGVGNKPTDYDERDVKSVADLAWDIAQRKRAEEEKEKLQAQLLQAQKMESVGRLAGGVAHEFNNKLMGMMNYIELCRDELPPQHRVRSYLDEMSSDAQYAADIARQILAFARRQPNAPEVLDLNEVLAGMHGLLRSQLGENIDLVCLPGEALWTVRMDPSQFQRILLCLCANAQEAIDGAGSISIETANVTLGDAHCAEHPDAPPGDYVKLLVSDTGCGMSSEVLDRIFDPFFTTKEVGKGTGLGLPAVLGVVEQHDGFIDVHSEVGKGTTLSVYLPRAVAESGATLPAAIPGKVPRGTETILLAEDEKSIRVTARIFLDALGYTVLTAAAPAEALRLAAEHHGQIDLLIADMIMPGMSGGDLARQLAGVRPGLKCLFMSGYPADVVTQQVVLDEGVQFLAKPFSRDSLARKVRAILDEGGPAGVGNAARSQS